MENTWMRKSTLVLTTLTLLGTSACSNTQVTSSVEPEEESTVEVEVESVKETVMVYMVGSNLESQVGCATSDLQEMVLSGYDSEEVNIVVCAGGADNWWNDSVDEDDLSVYLIEKKDLTNVYEMKNDNMGDADTLTEFIDYTYENYKAENYSIIFWNHGGGAVIGYGADEQYGNDMLSMAELKSAVAESQLVEDTKFEWVGFDACLMGMVEVADAFSDYANYLIASEEVEAGEGWDYSFLADMTDEDAYKGNETGEFILKAFGDFYADYPRYNPDYTLSCVDLSKVGQVVEDLEELVTVASAALKDGEYSRIAKLRDGIKSFGRVSDSSFYDYIDLYALAESLKAEYPNEAKALMKSYEEAVVSNTTNVQGANGLSVYFPYENKEYATAWVEAYEETEFSSVYTEFIKDFAEVLSDASIYDWDLTEITPVQSTETSEYYIQLTEEQVAAFAHANSSIWQNEAGADSYICWINSQNVSLSEDGKLSSLYDNRIFYMENGEGESIPVCAVEIEHTDSYSKYAIPVYINVFQDDMQNAYIHVKVTEENPDGEICGVYSVLDSESELYPDKNIIQIEEGDTLTSFVFARNIVFLDDNTVAPFDDWESSSGLADEITVTGGFSVSLKDNVEDGDYAFIFRVTDTQGNSYFTNYLSVSKADFKASLEK